MPSDNTPVWQIYGMPQPTFNQGGGEQPSNQANQGSLQPMPSFGDVKNGVGQAGKDMSIAGNLFGSDTLKNVGGDITKGIGDLSSGSGILGALLALL